MRTGTLYIALAMLAPCASAQADDAPKPLAATYLYQKLAHDCRSVPLATWAYPTRQVLLRNKVQLESLELCNGGTYPIYHVRFTYDPRTSNTNSFFTPLYDDMLRANGRHAFSFVDSNSNWISMISWAKGTIKEESDEYVP